VVGALQQHVHAVELFLEGGAGWADGRMGRGQQS
jgi:hypothetical protein